MLYKIAKVIITPILKLLFWYNVENKPTNIPKDNLIICSNHISLWDPIFLVATFDREISFMAKKELFDNKFLAWLLTKLHAFPVDRGNNDIDAVRKSINVLKENKVLGIFPEGTRIKNPQNISRDNFNNGIAMIAKRSKSDILPVEISGRFRLFSRPKIKFKEIIKHDEFDEIKNKKEQYELIVDEVYNKIFKS